VVVRLVPPLPVRVESLCQCISKTLVLSDLGSDQKSLACFAVKVLATWVLMRSKDSFLNVMIFSFLNSSDLITSYKIGATKNLGLGEMPRGIYSTKIQAALYNKMAIVPVTHCLDVLDDLVDLGHFLFRCGFPT
jgi:hypothetical protein